MNPRLAPLLLLAVLGVGACSPWERVRHGAPTGAVGAGIDHARWSRDLRLYDQLETTLLAQATLLAPPLEAQLATAARREVPGVPVTDQVGFPLGVTEARVVLVAAGRWRNLGADGPWSIQLHTPFGSVLPAQRERLLGGPVFERYFPAWNPWSTVWLLRFPVPVTALEGSVELELRLPGGTGGRLRWP